MCNRGALNFFSETDVDGLKLLIVSDYASPLGGAEVLHDALRRSFSARGIDVRLFSSRAHDHSNADYTCFGTTSRFRTAVQAANYSAARQLKKVLAEFEPDVVHLHVFLTQLSPLILPLLKDIPTVYYAVWYRSICPTGTKFLKGGGICTVGAGRKCIQCLPARDWVPLMFQLALFRRWRGYIDRVVVGSKAQELELKKAGVGVHCIIPHGVELRRQPRTGPAQNPTIAFAGRCVTEKGIFVLLEALAQVCRTIPECLLLFVGDGPESENVDNAIDRLDLSRNVKRFGYLPIDSLNELFSTAWVQAIPSIWAEPFGLVAVDAMQRGTPVVASNIGGLGEIVVDGQSGLLVEPGDPQALAAAVLTVLNNKKLASTLRNNGRERARSVYTLDQCAESFHNLYEEMLLA